MNAFAKPQSCGEFRLSANPYHGLNETSQCAWVDMK